MSSADRTAAIELTTPIQYLKGCGDARAELLAKLGVRTVRDLLFLFPRDYQDLTDLRTIDQLEENVLVSVLATVEEVDARSFPGGKSVLGVLLSQPEGHLRAIWYNQPFLRDKFRQGQLLLVSGKPRRKAIRWEMSHPQVRVIDTPDEQPQGQLLPVYPLTAGLNVRNVRTLMRRALDICASQLDEVFPAEYLAQHNLWPIAQALSELHFPSSADDLERARRRFVYQELLILQLALALKRHKARQSLKSVPLERTTRIDARIRRLLPFELTPGQNQAVDEITADMAHAYPMNRLLQGDVGSGKTMVAVYAMLLAVAHGAQVALMAPTEVLARQHFQTLSKLLAKSHTKLGLLTGAVTGKDRDALLLQIAAGQVQIVIGTQAVVSGGLFFRKLGLVVIDEQHKFGVRERAALRRSGTEPHYLVMTATPIPRTVTMTLFGDLDTTTLADSPPGRQTVHTYLPKYDDRERWWEFFRKKLREGRQAYVVVPLVESAPEVRPEEPAPTDEETAPGAEITEGETVAPAQLTSLAAAYEALANGELEAFRLGMIHGRMSSGEKETVMDEFRSGKIQVLVATSVVEVGVDVPNATLMTIENAERFGLAQLHQLRGRISRGTYPGYCCLFAGTPSPEAAERLEAFVGCTDGFKLAELDFQMRGPGDLLGTRQHGMPPLRLADLVRDAAVLEEARRDARQLVESDPELALPEHALIKRMAHVRYGKVLELGDVG